MPWVGYRTCAAADVPTSDDWLSPAERETLARLKIDKRRNDFRVGRFVAKRALSAAWARASYTHPSPRFQVIAAVDGAPEPQLEDGTRAPFCISLSHSHGRAACAVAPAPQQHELRLGCDLELVEPRSEELIRQFFTAAEQRCALAAPASEAPLIATLIWSAKESALKALRSGLRADTRSVLVEWHSEPGAGIWQPLSATAQDGSVLSGHWRTLSESDPGQPLRAWVLTVLSNGACALPEHLSD